MNCHPSSTYGATPDTFRDADVVAIVSAACRYPGGCGDPEAFWEMMERGRTGFRAAPQGRSPGWNRIGGFLDAPFPHAFDAAFFDIAPAEAVGLDPQHRLGKTCRISGSGNHNGYRRQGISWRAALQTSDWSVLDKMGIIRRECAVSLSDHPAISKRATFLVKIVATSEA